MGMSDRERNIETVSEFVEHTYTRVVHTMQEFFDRGKQWKGKVELCPTLLQDTLRISEFSHNAIQRLNIVFENEMLLLDNRAPKKGQGEENESPEGEKLVQTGGSLAA